MAQVTILAKFLLFNISCYTVDVLRTVYVEVITYPVQ